MGKDSTPAPSTGSTQQQLTDPLKVPYYTASWNALAPMLQRAARPSPFNLGNMQAIGQTGPLFDWTNANSTRGGVASQGPIDWSKYFGNDVQNPYAPAYLASIGATAPQANPAFQIPASLASVVTPPPAAQPVAAPAAVAAPANPYQFQGAPAAVAAPASPYQYQTPTAPAPAALPAPVAAAPMAPAVEPLRDEWGTIIDQRPSSGDSAGKAGGIVGGGKIRHFDAGGSTDPYPPGAGAIDPNANGSGAFATATDTASNLAGYQAPANTTSPYQQQDYTLNTYSPNAVAASNVAVNPYTANSMSTPGNITGAQAGTNAMSTVNNAGTSQVTTGSAPGEVARYMNPYQQAVTDVALQQAQRTAAQQQAALSSQAQQAHAFGSYRQGLQSSENTRNENILENNIQTTGQANAYQSALAAYQADAARQLQAGTTNAANTLTSNLANQQAGMAAGQANLTAAQQSALSNQQAAMQAALANQQTGLTTGIQNLGAAQQTQGLNATQGLQALLANQQTGLQAQQLNQQAGLAANQQNVGNQQFGAQLGQQGQAQNAQYSLQSQLANIDNAYRAAGLQLQGGQLAAQTGAAQAANATTQRAQDLNASQFATTTNMQLMQALNQQYGAIENWPITQIQQMLAALK